VSQCPIYQSVSLSVGRSVCPVYCGKTTDWIWIPFRVVGWLGPWMRQINGVGYCRTARGNFWGGCVTNKDLLHSCVKMREAIELPFGADEWGQSGLSCIRWGPHPQREGEVLGVFLVHWFESIFVVHGQNRNVFDSCVKSL